MFFLWTYLETILVDTRFHFQCNFRVFRLHLAWLCCCNIDIIGATVNLAALSSCNSCPLINCDEVSWPQSSAVYSVYLYNFFRLASVKLIRAIGSFCLKVRSIYVARIARSSTKHGERDGGIQYGRLRKREKGTNARKDKAHLWVSDSRHSVVVAFSLPIKPVSCRQRGFRLAWRQPYDSRNRPRMLAEKTVQGKISKENKKESARFIRTH